MALENKLGITDSAELAREEERISKKKAVQMFESGALAALPTGTFAALYNKTWSSAAARRGLWHKLGSIFGVLVAAMCDLVLRLVGDNFGFELPMIGQSCLITPIVAAWYFFTELGSIVENAAAMGAPVPDLLKKLIARGKKTIDDKTGDGDNEE